MNFTLKKDEIKNLITRYYQEFENRKVTVQITNKKEYVGIYEDLSCVTSFTITEEMPVMGIKTEVKEKLNEEQLKIIFATLLAKENLELQRFEIKNGLSEKTVGYFMSEHTEKTSYFNGISLTVTKKEPSLARTLGR